MSTQIAETNRLLEEIRNYMGSWAAKNGDIFLTISPTTVSTVHRGTAWTRDVVLTLHNFAGDVCEWYNGTHATSASIADTSAGTASIASTTITFIRGVATITVTGNAVTWAAGETDTLTISTLTIQTTSVTGGTSVETFT